MKRTKFTLLFCISLIGCDYRYSKNNQNKTSVAEYNNKASDSLPYKGLAPVRDQIIGNNCLHCHNDQNPQGRASFTSIENIRRWAERIKYRTITQKTMPPGKPLSIEDLKNLERWIAQGSPDEKPVLEWTLPENTHFEFITEQILKPKCFACHSGVNPEANLDLENIQTIQANLESITQKVIIENSMPLAPFEKLTSKEKKLLSHWIIDGAPE